jgi:oxalate---CoA ligase
VIPGGSKNMPTAPSPQQGPAVPFRSLPQLLEYQAKRVPDAPAILAPGRPPLSHGRLYRHIEQVGSRLRTIGIGRGDRVAVVLPNGPEMAMAILAVAANAACAPINPAYGPEELDRYFANLRPRALIAEAGVDCAACRLALARGIRVVELSTASDLAAGLFRLSEECGGVAAHEPVNSGDVALLLLTSGTTAQPKIVPLTHANICASAHSCVGADRN